MNRIIVDYKANEGDRVLIKNPRSKVGAREWGTVTHVEEAYERIKPTAYTIRLFWTD